MLPESAEGVNKYIYVFFGLFSDTLRFEMMTSISRKSFFNRLL